MNDELIKALIAQIARLAQATEDNGHDLARIGDILNHMVTEGLVTLPDAGASDN